MTPIERFWARVDKSGQCWLWMGALTEKGYGVWNGASGRQQAHRRAWMLERGSIPKGLTLDHLCRNRACVNPVHLEPVTNRVNILRGIGITAQNARKTHCKHGHPFTVENTIYKHGGGWRICKICNRARFREYSARRRAAQREAA